MSGRDLQSRFGAMGISSPAGHGQRRAYDHQYAHHHHMAPQPQPPQSQPPPVQTPPQHRQQQPATMLQPLPPLPPTSGGPAPRPLPPLVAPLGSNDRPMFPDARQNEMSAGHNGGGGISSSSSAPVPVPAPTRRRPLPQAQPPSQPPPYAHEQQNYQQQLPQQYYQQQPQQHPSPQPSPLPSPRGGYSAESSNAYGAITPYEGDSGNGSRSQFALNHQPPPQQPYHPYGAPEEGERQIVPSSSPPDDNYYRQHRYSDVPPPQPPRSQPLPNRSHRPSPRSAYHDDWAYEYRQEQPQCEGNEYHYNDNYNSKSYPRQHAPHGPSPRFRRRPSFEDYRDDDDDRFRMMDSSRRRRGPLPSSPAGRGRFPSPRRRRLDVFEDSGPAETAYFERDDRRRPSSRAYQHYDHDDDDGVEDADDYRQRIVYSPSVESDISTRSAASSRQARSNGSRYTVPQPSPRELFDEDDLYEVEYSCSRRDRLRSPTNPSSRSSSRGVSAYDSGRRRLSAPLVVEEEEDLYDVEIHHPSILRRSPRQQHSDLGRRVTFSPSTELPDEDSYASQRSVGSRSTAGASVAHGVITSQVPSHGNSRLASLARQQVVAEIKQAMEMRDSARDVRDVEFWERQIKTLNRALRKLGSSAGAIAERELSDGFDGGRDLLTSSSWQSEESSSRTSAISGRSNGSVRVRAPADLPGGYEFTAKVHGSEIRAIVPRGGVRRGELFTVQPQADEFDLADISPPVSATKNIKVRAPSNLNEGHQLTLRRGGETIVATVPRGGVRAGELFTVSVSR